MSLLSTLGWVAAGTAAVLVLTSDAKADSGGGGIDPNAGGDMSSNRQRLRAKLASIPEYDDTQRALLDIWAKAESNFNPNAHNNTPSEREASRRGLNNNPSVRHKMVMCGLNPALAETGSWGAFQRLAPFLVSDVFEIFGDSACGLADPTRTTLDLQIASINEMLHDLQGYNGFKAKPTVGNLRLGGAAASLMGYLSDNADRIERYRKTAVALGYPASIIEQTINRFPANSASIYQRLVQGAL